MTESRREKRYPVDWRVAFRCPDWDTVSRVAAENASRGGLFLLTSRPPSVGAKVELTIELPDGHQLKVVATVQHVITPERAAAEGRGPGFGVRVDEAHASDLILLEEMALAAVHGTAPARREIGEGLQPPVDDAEPLAEATSLAWRPSKITEPPARVAGIDLGSSFASLAVASSSTVHLVTDEDGRSRQPSVVSFPAGKPAIAGWTARARLVEDPRATIAGARRLLGKRCSDPRVLAWLRAQAYRTAPGPADEVQIVLGEARHDVTRVCAAVLAHLRSLGEKQLDREIVEVVLAAPAGGAAADQAELRAAAELAGLEVRDIIFEPVAAALATGAGRNPNEIIAVCDFGGGHVDCTILEGMRVLSSGGDDLLGGDELDQALAQAVADDMWRSNGVELRRRLDDWLRLVIAVEQAKRALSSAESTQVSLEVEGSLQTIRLTHPLQRELLDRVARELIERSLACCRAALGGTGLQADAVDRVLVVGGMANVPCMRAAVNRLFARTVDVFERPDELVVRGIALHAASLAGVTTRSSS